MICEWCNQEMTVVEPENLVYRARRRTIMGNICD